jgi:serine/threonine-protein kinase
MPNAWPGFQREAELLAALNYPNVAAIYGLEKTLDFTALVLELVEGEDLAQRLARGPIALDETLPIARQIADALEAAHEHGIIHRDLKPANIKVRADGTVKVLDFGLAKAMDVGAGGSGGLSMSPTITSPAMTRLGMILGTAAYMAPEQAKGKSADRRADIWAFGCVLYEMLTSQRAFLGDDVTDTIAAVVSKEPEWQRLPNAATAARPLLVRCLEKDPKQRLQAIGDARIQIDELTSGTSDKAPLSPPPVSFVTRHAVPLLLAAATGSALIAALANWTLARRTPQVPEQPIRFEIVQSPALALSMRGSDRDIAISPDGRHIVYRRRTGAAGAALARSTRHLRDRGNHQRARPVLLAGWPMDRLLRCRRAQEGQHCRRLTCDALAIELSSAWRELG